MNALGLLHAIRYGVPAGKRVFHGLFLPRPVCTTDEGTHHSLLKQEGLCVKNLVSRTEDAESDLNCIYRC